MGALWGHGPTCPSRRPRGCSSRQVFQARGSHSFLVCGVIFASLAFTFYVLLLFFHRMYAGLSSGKGKSLSLRERGGRRARLRAADTTARPSKENTGKC